MLFMRLLLRSFASSLAQRIRMHHDALAIGADHQDRLLILWVSSSMSP